jgi:hypothetical protein
MSIVLNNRTYIGMSALTIKRLRDGVIYNFPTPEGFNLVSGIQQRVQTGRSAQGQAVRLRSYKTGEFPELVISYSVIRPELISFTVGTELVAGTYATNLPKLLQVTSVSYPAAAIGYLGKGILVDAVTEASVIDPLTNASTSLTQVPFAVTPLVGTLSFSVGVDGALKFTPDLLGKVVAMSIPYTVPGNAWTDLLSGDHSVSALVVDTENTVTIFEAYLATPNLEGGQINPSAEGSELKLFLNTPPGSCRAYNMIETALKVAC